MERGKLNQWGLGRPISEASVDALVQVPYTIHCLFHYHRSSKPQFHGNYGSRKVSTSMCLPFLCLHYLP